MTKIGLALGGGAARGAAHIGVLYELERLGIRPDLITGTSIGAMMGAMLACGLTAADMQAVFAPIRAGDLYESIPGGIAVTGLGRVVKILEDAIGRPQFSQLKVPLAVVATDLVTRREVVLDDGDVIEAVEASVCVPIMFPPVQRGDMHLVDGGLVNSVPFDVARARGAGFVIAVDLGMVAPYGTPAEYPLPTMTFGSLFNNPTRWVDMALAQVTNQPIWQVMSAVFDIATRLNVELRLAMSPPDVLLRPLLGTIGMMDFHTQEAGIAAGRAAAQAMEAELRMALPTLVLPERGKGKRER